MSLPRDPPHALEPNGYKFKGFKDFDLHPRPDSGLGTFEMFRVLSRVALKRLLPMHSWSHPPAWGAFIHLVA